MLEVKYNSSDSVPVRAYQQKITFHPISEQFFNHFHIIEEIG